jgi:hypothetical protein
MLLFALPLRKKLRDASLEGDQPFIRSLAVVVLAGGLREGCGLGAGRSRPPVGGESSPTDSVGKEKPPKPPASA